MADYRAVHPDGSPNPDIQPYRSAGNPFGGKGAPPFGKKGGASKPPAGKSMSKGGRR